MKKNIYTCLLILFFVALIFIYCILRDSSSKHNVLSYDLNNNIYNKYGKTYQYEIYYVENNTIYGSIYDDSKSDILYSTIDLFRYSLDDQTMYFFQVFPENMVVDYYISDNVLYYLSLNSQNDNYQWMLTEYNFSDGNEIILDTGIMKDSINYPNLYIYQGNPILTIISDVGEMQRFSIKKYENNESVVLFKSEGHKQKSIGTIAFNMINFKMINNKIYYTMIEENDVQVLYEYDLNYGKIERKYINDNSKLYIQNYHFKDEFNYYILLANRQNFEDSTMIVSYNGNNKIIKTGINTFGKRLNDNELLFHNDGNVWKKLNFDSGTFDTIHVLDFSVYPNYYIIDVNKILVRSIDSDNLFVIYVN